LAEGLPDGASPGAVLPRERLHEMIQAYYEARGWDHQGNVPPETPAQMDLVDSAS
jgi:aldehyde:ferredoxin oxidoreductase